LMVPTQAAIGVIDSSRSSLGVPAPAVKESSLSKFRPLTTAQQFQEPIAAGPTVASEVASAAAATALEPMHSFADSAGFADFMLMAAKKNSTLLQFFYGGKGYAGDLEEARAHYHFRMSNCKEGAHKRGGKNYGGDLIHEKVDPQKPCLWSNMAPRKLLAVVALAQELGVTHLIESGRMGGMSALMYDAVGFNLTSVEFYPVASVEEDMNKYAPGITTLNGDGTTIVPEVVKQLLGSGKRVGVILDGPKGDAAYELAKVVLSLGVSFVAIDDSQKLTKGIDETPHVASFHIWDRRYLDLFPLEGELATVKGVHLQLKYIHDGDCLSLLVPTQE